MEINTVVYLLFCLFHLISGNYEYICEIDFLKKPYLKIYDTKLGDLLMEEIAPGFYEVGHLKNIYVCLNGPVVAYFTRYTIAGDVFDEARNTLEIHKCKYYNGDPGPGSTKKADHLKAILLMGDERDYNLPIVKTFTAPLLLDVNTGLYRNVTSLITIGSKSCTIYKSPTQQPIKLEFLDDYAQFSMCRLPYQRIEVWTNFTAAAGINVNATQVQELLSNDHGVVEGECEKAPDVNDFKKILADLIEKENVMISLKSEAKPFFGATPTDKSGEVKTKNDDITKTKDDIAKATNPADKTKLEGDLKDMEFDLYLLEAEQFYYDVHKELGTTIEAAAGAVDTSAADQTISGGPFKEATDKFNLIKGQNDLIDIQKAEMVHWNAEVESLDPSAGAAYTNALEKYQAAGDEIDRISKDIQQKFLEAALFVRKASDLLRQVQHFLPFIKWAKNEVEVATKTKTEKTKIDSSALYKKIADVKLLPFTVDVNITAENTNSTGHPQDICDFLPFVGPTDSIYRRDPSLPGYGACYTEKGTKLFGCQMLKARLGEPGICALHEFKDSDDNDVPTKDVPPVTDFLPQHMIDVLNLITVIYQKACKRIRPAFPHRVNNLLQCYIVKDRTQKNLFSTDGTTPSRLKFWGKIIGALEDCRDAGHVLEFARESQEVAKYYLKKDDDYLEVPFLKEQAENEYGFNFAIDMAWKVFATVLGLCMPSYESKIPLITTRFFTMFTEEFLLPLQEIWISEKDNNIFKRIMSYYYAVGGAEPWASYCMEASFLYSSDVSYRPPRKLPVNGRSESNYFVRQKSKKRK